jgi:hypothetical protein
MTKIKTIKWKYSEPVFTPFGIAGGNYVYQISEDYFSYNPSPNNNFIDNMLGMDTGEETAFYDAKDKGFVILLGDFRNEVSERKINTRKKALDFCREKYPECGSPRFTTHSSFN